MSRTATTDELCVRCGVNPRRPMAETCAPCRHEDQLAYFRERQRRIREASYTVKESPCKCGCGLPVVYPTKFATEACKEIGKRACRERSNEQRRKKNAEAAKTAKSKAASKPRGDHAERFGLKPHRPDPLPQRKPVISEEEQARLDAEASARDREWNKKFFKKTLGLESPAPGKPLASKVVRPPEEVFKLYEEQYKPLRDVEREFHIPLRADISYN